MQILSLKMKKKHLNVVLYFIFTIQILNMTRKQTTVQKRDISIQN